jgi:hypothetical protein
MCSLYTRNVNRLSLATAGALVLLISPGSSATAHAQACGAWPRPVICEAELVATGGDRRTDRLGERSRYRIAPGGQVDLALVARDQRGRRFPDDRLGLQHDEGQCRRLLDIDGRSNGLRVTARSDAGRCRLVLWVPGNLNFEWEIEFEVDPGARTGYSRTEAEHVVARLYRALLERDADGSSVRAATSEVQRGNLDQLVDSMVRSPEFRSSLPGVSAEQLLDRFYRGIFGRDADTGGVREYLGDVRARQYTSVILRMIRSAEFERRLPG